MSGDAGVNWWWAACHSFWPFSQFSTSNKWPTKTSHLCVWVSAKCRASPSLLHTWTELAMSLPRTPVLPARLWGWQRILWARDSRGGAIGRFNYVRSFWFISGLITRGYTENVILDPWKPFVRQKHFAKYPKGEEENNISLSKKGHPE